MNTTTVDSKSSFEVGVTIVRDIGKKREYYAGQKGKEALKVDIEIGTELVIIPAGDITVEQLNLSKKALEDLKANREKAKTTERWTKLHGKDIEIGD